jgi:hypothetical protein
MNNWSIFCFSRIILQGILIFKWLTARRLYKSFGVKGLIKTLWLAHKSLHSLLTARQAYRSDILHSLPDVWKSAVRLYWYCAE